MFDRRWMWVRLVCTMVMAIPMGSPLAADFPSRPIRIVVPFAPGGAVDLLARQVGKELSTKLGQPVIIDNKPGAGGALGTEAVVRAPADGHTLLMHSSAALTDSLLKKGDARYDLRRDLAPTSMMANGPWALVVHPSLPVKRVADLLAYARRNPGVLNYSSSGIGSSAHLAAELFQAAANLKMTHVPYSGGSQALLAVAANEVQLGFAPIGLAKSFAASGKVLALAVSSNTQTVLWPELPTIASEGLPDFHVVSWAGLFLPAKTPDGVVDTISAAVADILKEPQMRKWVQTNGLDVVANRPTEFRQQLDAEFTGLSALIRSANIVLP